MSTRTNFAPPLKISQWFNTDAPVDLATLRGRVVVMYAFQMLCPACVMHGLPQAMKVHQYFPHNDVVVLGLHTVFEHHNAMAPHSLQAFLHEYGIAFAVGVDQPSVIGPIPVTMQAYGLHGTPSLVVINRQGAVCLNYFGHVDDLQLGTLIGTLLSEPAGQQPLSGKQKVADNVFSTPQHPSCNEHQCDIPG